ncbi:hypothetical protein BDB00DRAFT_842982 [Zychaea mexicana]|uniref:uncharacterized protein n=1 Tax=Zychaea mexicana TaxID=64656 RepID=UPI0022FE2E98|nr:uncharacterized protein BDB00DRAFT_842982 [Zychaea mexicana]KAI9489454.1 hypothetical protein BDB00DRAFT_842982 [Zychaea mexicana]
MNIGRFSTYSNLVRHWYLLFLFNILILLLLLGYRCRPLIGGGQWTAASVGDRFANGVANDQIPIADYLAAIEGNDDYAIDAALIRLFPTRAYEVIQELEDYRAQSFLFRPLWTWWHARQSWKRITSATLPAFAGNESVPCPADEIPLPLLRRMVSNNLGLPDPRDGHTIDEPYIFITQAQSRLCVRAVIPEPSAFTTISSNVSEYHYFYQPADTQQSTLRSPWWDSFMVYAFNMDTDGTIPVHMEPWKGHKKLRDEWLLHSPDKPHFMLAVEVMMHERKLLHIYEGSLALPDPGLYKLDARLEYQGGEWNFEKGPIVPYNPDSMDVYPHGLFSVSNPMYDKEEREHMNEENDGKDTEVRHIVAHHMSLPLCTRADLPGRWLPSFALPTDRSAEPAALDRNDKFWAPYACRLRRISYEDFGACLKKKFPRGIDTYGDSNTRRSIKKIITHGRWCDDWHLVGDAGASFPPKEPFRAPPVATVTNTSDTYDDPPLRNQSADPLNWDYIGSMSQLRSCYCEDFKEPGWNKEWFDPEKRSSVVWVGNKTTGVRLHSYKWDGLTYLNNPSWRTALEATTLAGTIGDAAIISVGNWDAAFMKVEQFEKQLDILIELVRRRYSNKLIIYRTPQYYCCRVDHSDRNRLVSGPRVQLFDQLARDRFLQAFNNLMVWDTMTMGESRTWEEKQLSNGCASNHVAADVVEVENQLLMNALCNAN